MVEDLEGVEQPLFEGNGRPLSNLLSFSYSAFLASWGVPMVFWKFHELLGDCDLRD